MACAIAAQKLRIPVAHVEAGIRSGDWAMPEEINRLVTDSITNWFFTTSEVANQNLRKAGIGDERIFFVGNTMIDTLLDDPAGFRRLLDAVNCGVRGLPVVFPVHPRTAKTLQSLDGRWSSLQPVDPLGYLEFNHLVRHAKGVITDSGGVTEETTVMGVPCLTLRDTTERPETVTMGTNELIGTDPAALQPALDRLFEGQWKKGSIPDLWDGRTSVRIVEALERLLCA
jgi:UDP-N-acetylglucosamine 2-epimerase (non-hydrolysing)